LINDVVEKQKSESFIKPRAPFLIEKQKELGLKVMKHLGFDFTRGRIDISSHPFCGGVPEDVRITTRYDENDFIQSLMGTVHETGHARYEQNLPLSYISLPVGNARSMGIHESQSLFFEMQMGRGRPFLESIHSYIIESFGNSDAFSIDNLCKIYAHVKPDYIRVDADEVTYPAHVMLRYEIEKALINGELEPKDIPEVWDEKMQSYLGINTKGNYKNGVMQDVHWTEGLIGYFPSYTLGAMYAAQQFNTVKQKFPDVNERIAKGDFSQVFGWLKENIWQEASFHSTNDLIKNATGESLNPKYFKEHLINRYLKD
ncbi:MAG: carboxypeptidase M32, partial [Campylobacteraceae bacterium]|nr:carboxypeptidase M32 [Campylobacteraceae bacterium]